MNYKNFGYNGESFVASTLSDMGYKIIMRNYQTKYGEIDIITFKDGVISFWEVKTRTSDLFGDPKDSVDTKKVRRIRYCANLFLQNCKINYKETEINVAEVNLRLIENCG